MDHPKDPDADHHNATCNRCAVIWQCRCLPGAKDRTKCLFDWGLCDDCQLRHLYAEPHPEVPAVQCPQ